MPQIADVLGSEKFEDGDIVIRQGDTDANRFYIIDEGVVRVEQEMNDTVVMLGKLKTADYFGEVALLRECPRNATLIAEGIVRWALGQ